MGMESRFGRGGLNDQFDADELLDSIGLDAEEIAWRKQHIGFDEADAERLDRLADLFGEHSDEVAERFYENLTSHDRTMAVIDRSEKSVEQLKETQRAYLVTLATGDYDQGYFRNRARIGKVHELLDMPLHFYVGQYGVYYDLVIELLDDRIQQRVVDAIREWADDRDDEGVGGRLLGALGRDDEDPLSESFEATVRDEIHEGIADLLAVLRAFNLDMQVAVDTYVDSYSSRLERAIERRERLAREVTADVQAPLADVETAVEQVADDAQEISALAHETDEAMATVAEEMTDLSAATEEIASTADEVHERTTDASETAREGRDRAETAIETVADLGEAADDAATAVSELDEVFEALDETLDGVDDIARRTKQLGRRATLDATGVSGRNEELKELADEVKGFAEETEDQLETMQRQVQRLQRRNREAVVAVEAALSEVESGTGEVEGALRAFEEVVEAVDEAADGVADVAEATDSQAHSVERVTTVAEETADKTGRVADRTDDIAAATEEQQAQLRQIAHNVDRLTDDETGAAAESD